MEEDMLTRTVDTLLGGMVALVLLAYVIGFFA